MSVIAPQHFLWEENNSVGIITLNRPEKKNPLTFDSYQELVSCLKTLATTTSIRALVIRGAGGNFCSGGDVKEIIGPLTKMTPGELLKFTEMTCELIAMIREVPQVVIAAIDGVCAGAGAAVAMAADIRLGTPESRVAFLFAKVGLAGCDMGACFLLPRLIGLGRATELLLSGRFMSAEESLAWGFYSRLVPTNTLRDAAVTLAAEYAAGPVFAHGVTKRAINSELSMGLPEALQSEAIAQALCMGTNDFRRAYEAFLAKQKPIFEGN